MTIPIIPGRDHRNVTLDVTITSETRGAAEADAALAKVDKSADKAGSSLRDMAADAKWLNAEIAKTKDRLGELDSALIAVGGEDKTVKQEIRQQESKLAFLQKLAKRAGTEAAPGFVQGLIANIGELPAQLKGFGIVGGAAVGAAMAPFIAAAVSGAVLGGVGAGGVVGGAVLAAQDQRVKDAWSTLGLSIMHQMEPAKEAFVGPIVEAANTVGQAFRDGDFVETLKQASALVDPLTKGVSGFVRELGPGLQSAVSGSAPVVRVLSIELPELGEAISSMLDSMAATGPEAAIAMKDLFDGLETGTKLVGDTLGGLTALYAATRSPVVGPLMDLAMGSSVLALIGKVRKELAGPQSIGFYINESGEAAAGSSYWMKTYGQNLTQIGDTLSFINRALEENEKRLRNQFDAGIDASRAADGYEAAIDDLNEALKENGTTIDANTEKGRENREMFRQAVEAAQRSREANIVQGMSVADANRLYGEQIKAIEGIAKAAGVTKGELQGLAGDYRIHVQTTYTSTGKPPLGMTNIKFSRLDYPEAFVQPSTPQGGQRSFGGGGDTPAFEPFRVHDGEVLFSSRQHYVATKSQVDTMSRGGNQTVTVVIDVRGGDDDIKQMVRKWVALDGGGDVQVALGRRS